MRALRYMGVTWLAVGLVGFLSPRDARAQSLHLAELFAEQGRLDDARAEVLAWFEIRGQEATPTELQHALWLRARFAPDAAEGARELEAFVREYPAGPFTARALAWMAAAAADRGGEARAIELYTRVLRDFPESDRVAEARDWLKRRGVVVEAPPVEERMPVPAVVTQADTAAAADPAQVGDTLGASPETVADSLAAPLEPPVDTAAAPPDLPMDTAAAPPDLPMD
ncbi:MAG: tetratricopeptide repeat protein, partial [Gemmatimonadetes bacterium]|nr:tetratricopeptide repeat protein [Gemmatimonadota bacterium]